MSMVFFESEFNMPAKMVVLPVRSIVIKTKFGLVIVSPINFSNEQLNQIRAMGPVTDLVAPSLLHHVFLPAAIKNFKDANVWGPPGIREKLPAIKWNKILTVDPWTHQPEIELLLMQGSPRLNEVVFFHIPSKTLVVTDFVFNLLNPKGWASGIVLRMMGTYRRFAVSKLVMRYTKNKSALKESIKKLLNWDFDRIVMAHGNIVLTNGKQTFVQAIEERELYS